MVDCMVIEFSTPLKLLDVKEYCVGMTSALDTISCSIDLMPSGAREYSVAEPKLPLETHSE